MSTLASLTDRVALYLQDTEYAGWTRTQMETQVGEEVQRLARQELFGALVWRHGIAGQAQYLLPDETVALEELLYDGRPLRLVEETSLTRLARQWEARHATPEYYTLALQPAQVVRLVPQPLFGGAPPAPAGSLREDVCVGMAQGVPALPAIPWAGLRETTCIGRPYTDAPLLPFEARLDHNLLCFTWEHPARDGADLGLLEALDDVVVFNAVGELCGQATAYHDLEKSVVFLQLGRMLLERVLDER